MRSRLVRWGFWGVGVLGVLTCALGGYASLAASSSPRSPSGQGQGVIVHAHTLRDDQFMAGPVLVGHRAVWVEAGQRLVVRSLDAGGGIRTIFSTSATPGAPKGTIWPYEVESIAAGGGRVAFLEAIVQCGSAPPRERGTLRCTPSTYGFPLDSLTLFAGRPGAIRPVETWRASRQRQSCHGRPSPAQVAVANAGLVVAEWPCPAPGQHLGPGPRLVLRSFSGRLLRVLANRLGNVPQFVVAGNWLAFINRAQVFNQPDELQIIRISTGQTALTRMYPSDPSSGHAIDAVTVDRSGRYAVLTCCGRPPPCKNEGGFEVLSEGQIGHPGTQILAKRAHGEAIQNQQDLAISGDRVAYGQPTVHCPSRTRVATAAPGFAATTLTGLKIGHPEVAYDGRMVATAHDNTVQLTEAPG
jgi:hypothetical protein